MTLVLIEHDAGRVRTPSLHAVEAARRFGEPCTLLVLGRGLTAVAGALTAYGAARVLVGDHEALEHPLADRYAAVVAHAARSTGAKRILGAASTFTKDVLPRAAALLDLPMLSDVTGIESVSGAWQFRRPIYAGSAFATVTVEGEGLALTIRAAAFEAPEPQRNGPPSPIEPIQFDYASLPNAARYLSAERRESARPDLTEARIVVSGGRPLKDSDTFERLIGTLADALGAAVGSTRAAVDAGIVPNDWQIGQTGKVIAPDLYIAAGVSGAIQHLAGIKDARIIVAINKDPDAPIFQTATYGVVGDLYDLVPQLIEAIRNHAAGQ